MALSSDHVNSKFFQDLPPGVASYYYGLLILQAHVM